MIEWFLEEERSDERWSGGDYLQSWFPSFDRTKGRSHSWTAVSHLFNTSLGSVIPNWRQIWFEMMAFDAIIGNTDRHQENWAILFLKILDPDAPIDGRIRTFENSLHESPPSERIRLEFRIAPFFDNGTSLGHELADERISRMSDDDIRRYLLKGRGHLRWEGESSHGLRHFELIDRLALEIPENRALLQRYHGLTPEQIRQILRDLIAFQVPQPLSPVRGDFMERLVTLRRQELLTRLP